MKINENVLAAAVAKREGGKEVNIAQIKEVLKVTFHLLARVYKPSEILALIEKHR